jgi:hypothetical protein
LYDLTLETLAPDRLREHQWRRFRAMAGELLASNRFVAEKWRAAGVASVDDLGGWDDFRRFRSPARPSSSQTRPRIHRSAPI